jgi:dipeptidyl aminopeptidase/acylaminoacyl peptidase
LLPPDGAESRGKGAASSNGRGRSRTKAWPAALMIHGGPHAQFGSGFFHEMQALAAEGFVVVYPNPRGSKGYGRDFCDAIRGAWGGKDWDDVRATIAFMQQHPSIDAERMSIMGGSYGGYITNYAIGQTDVFKAAISDRCVSNLVSHLGNSDYYHKPGRYFPGNFWCDNEELWRQSPIRFVDNVATPTLVIHSEGDLRCNVEQGEQLFAALQIRGVPSRMVRYPRSTFHGMSRNGPVDLREHRLRQMLEWLRKWV